MKNLTIKEIAQMAGVSKSTVSRYFSNPNLVNEKTRIKVKAIVDKYSFVPNSIAQSLAGLSTKTIGVVVDELYNSFFIELIEGLDNVLSQKDYFMQMYSSHWNEKKEERAIRSLIQKQVDGIILAPVNENSKSIELLQKSNIPFIILNCKIEKDNITYLCSDNFKGGSLVGEYINSLNKDQVILITGYSHQTLDDRVSGFFSKVNKKDVICYSDIKTFEDGLKIASLLLYRNNLKTRKSIIFVTNDNVAIGLCSKLLELGVNIPLEVSVIGYDDIKLSSLCKVALTTVSQSISDMGRLAALSLLDKIDLKETKSSIIDPILIVRDSTK